MKKQCIECWGDYAYFGNSMYGAHRQSYEIPTPAAVVGIYEAIYWKPCIRWVPDEIQIMRPTKYVSIMRNELRTLPCKWNEATCGPYHVQAVRNRDAERIQRCDRILKDVRYRFLAHLEYDSSKETEPGCSYIKHVEMFERRAKHGQCVHQPYFGAKEYVAHYRWVDLDDPEEWLDPKDLAGCEPSQRGIMHYGWDWSGKKPIPLDFTPLVLGSRVWINAATCQEHIEDNQCTPYPVMRGVSKKNKKNKKNNKRSKK